MSNRWTMRTIKRGCLINNNMTYTCCEGRRASERRKVGGAGGGGGAGLGGLGQGAIEGDRQTDRQTETERQRQTETETENSSTLFYKDCSLGSVKT